MAIDVVDSFEDSILFQSKALIGLCDKQINIINNIIECYSVASLPVPGVHAAKEVRAGAENERTFPSQLGRIPPAFGREGRLAEGVRRASPIGRSHSLNGRFERYGRFFTDQGRGPHPLADKLVTRLTQLTPAEETLVTDAEKSAGLQISSLLTCVSMTEETEATQRLKSAESLAACLRALPVMAVRGDTTLSVLMLYEVDGAGEHSVAPRRLACPLRKDHLSLAVTSVLLTRSEVPLDDLDFESLGVVPDKADVLLD